MKIDGDPGRPAPAPAGPAVRRSLGPPTAPALRRHRRHVETDEGIIGVGSGDTMDGFEPTSELFLGTDPLAIARHVRTLETIAFHAGRYWPLEVALWDLMGKVAGLPVATLFGGAADRLPAYASTGRAEPPAERAEQRSRPRRRASAPMKIRIDRDRLDEGVATVAAVREAVGPDFEIMVDLNQSWRMPGDIEPALDPAAVRRIVRPLAELDVFWLEEPLPSPTSGGLRRCAPARGPDRGRGDAAHLRGRADALLTPTRWTSTRRTWCWPPGCPVPHHRPSWRSRGTALHPAHLDQRHRPAGQPARRGRGRRRPVSGVPLRPAGLDAGAPGLPARPAGADRRRRMLRCRDAPGLGVRDRPRGDREVAPMTARVHRLGARGRQPRARDPAVHRRRLRRRRRRRHVPADRAARRPRAGQDRGRRRARRRPRRCARRTRRSRTVAGRADPAAAQPGAAAVRRADGRAPRGTGAAGDPRRRQADRRRPRVDVPTAAGGVRLVRRGDRQALRRDGPGRLRARWPW